MPNTAIIFAKELTSWEHFPGDVPPESKSSWNALSHATQEELKADLAKQGLFFLRWNLLLLFYRNRSNRFS